MFLVIPLVEFLRMLRVDIDVHHENPATFLCHAFLSSVKCSVYRRASSVGAGAGRALPRSRARPPSDIHSGGCPSKSSSPSAKVTHGCLLRVQICRVGRSQEVSSSVPA